MLTAWDVEMLEFSRGKGLTGQFLLGLLSSRCVALRDFYGAIVAVRDDGGNGLKCRTRIGPEPLFCASHSRYISAFFRDAGALTPAVCERLPTSPMHHCNACMISHELLGVLMVAPRLLLI